MTLKKQISKEIRKLASGLEILFLFISPIYNYRNEGRF